MAETKTLTYRVASIMEGSPVGYPIVGSATVGVTFTEYDETRQQQLGGPPISVPPPAGGGFTLNLTPEEARQYFPGDLYTVTLTRKTD